MAATVARALLILSSAFLTFLVLPAAVSISTYAFMIYPPVCSSTPEPGDGEGGGDGGAQDGQEVGAEEGDGVERRAPLPRTDAPVEQVVDEAQQLVEQHTRGGLGEARVGERGMPDVAQRSVSHRVVGDEPPAQRIARRLERAITGIDQVGSQHQH